MALGRHLRLVLLAVDAPFCFEEYETVFFVAFDRDDLSGAGDLAHGRLGLVRELIERDVLLRVVIAGSGRGGENQDPKSEKTKE